MARPRKEIDQANFEKLCGMQCTKEEIASFFDVSEDTIERWCKRTYNANFAVVLNKKGAAGRISLRRFQFKLAEHNPTMAIWLGKQYLGQREPGVKVDLATDNDQVQQFLDNLRDGDGE